MPALRGSLFFNAKAMSIPMIIEIMGAPTIFNPGNIFTKSQAETAMAKQSKIPFPFVLKKFILYLPRS